MADKPITIDINNRLNRNLGLLHAGSMVTIDIVTPAGQKGKFRAIFVGYLPKQYVLIQFPETNKLGSFSQFIAQGMSVTIRGLIEGKEGLVVAFVSKIKQTIQIPSRLMVLDFPRSVTLQNLRSSVRIDTVILAKVKVDASIWVTTITDLSITGCHLDIDNGEKLALSEKKSIIIIIEGVQGLKNIKLSGEVCNLKHQSAGLSFGVKFSDNSKANVKELLHHALTF